MTRKDKYSYLVIQESYWENGKSRQRTIANLGRIDQLNKDYNLKNLLKSISKKADKDNKLYDIHDADEKERIHWGANAILQKLWSMLNLDKILLDATKNRKIEFDFYNAIFLMLADRFTGPCSKYNTFKTQDKYHKADKVQLHHFYRALDVLHTHKDDIELSLFKRSKKCLDNEIDIVFYDVSTLYFESVSPDVLKDFGYSKDAKFGEVQVVIGLLVSKEGLPLGFELFPGNSYEGDTLVKSLDKIKTRFKINKLIFVADQGMLNTVNLDAITMAGYEYIIGARIKNRPKGIKEDILDLSTYDTIETSDPNDILKSKTVKSPDASNISEIKIILSKDEISNKDLTAIRKICKEFTDTFAANRITTFLRNNFSDASSLISLTGRTKNMEKIVARIDKVKDGKLKERLLQLNDCKAISNYCKEFLKTEKKDILSLLDELSQLRLILTWSSKRKRKNEKDRERSIQKAVDHLDKKKPAVNKKGFKKYINTSIGESTLDRSKIVEEAQWDGFFGIQTSNYQMSSAEVSATYHMLWKIEESFRILKSHFEARPIYHWTPSRIHGHLVMCFIALMLERMLEIRLIQEGINHSPIRIREAINSLQASRFEVDGDEFYMRSSLTELGTKILKTLKIRIPLQLTPAENFQYTN